MAPANRPLASDAHLEWYPIDTVPAEQIFAWVRWHDNSQGITPLDAGRDATWWGSHGATHWRPLSDVEMATYTGLGR